MPQPVRERIVTNVGRCPFPCAFAITAFSPQLRQTDTNPRQNRNNAKMGRYCPKYGHILTQQDNSAYNTAFIPSVRGLYSVFPPFIRTPQPVRGYVCMCVYSAAMVGAVMIITTNADASGIPPTFPPYCVRALPVLYRLPCAV